MVAAIAIYISIQDFKFHIISDQLNLILLSTVFFGTLFLSYFENNFINFAISWLIALGVFCLLYFLAVVSRGAIGGGDVKFAPSLSVILAWLNGSSVVWFLFLAFQIAGLSALFRVVFKKDSLKQKIAFGPYLTMGYLATATYLLVP